MKRLKKDLNALTKTLKLLTKKTENMAKKLNKLEKAQVAKKRKTKTKVKRKAKTVAKRKVTKKVPAKRVKKVSATGTVLSVIKSSSKGVATSVLRKKTGIDDNKLRGIIFRLKQQGKITSVGRGTYSGK